MSRIEAADAIERTLWKTADLDAALRIRDEKRKEDGREPSAVLLRVTDSRDAERGDADWCEFCAAHGAFSGEQGFMCELCEQGFDAEEGRG